MKTLIFVYTNAQFSVGGAQPVKQYEPGTSFERAVTAIKPGTTGTLEKGIYLIYGNSERERPEIKATVGTSGVDHELIEVSNKDKWPVPKLAIGPSDRIKEAFPKLDAGQLNEFFYEDVESV